MRQIEIENDVYDYLRRNVERIGEDASSILRRLLKLPSAVGTRRSGTASTVATYSAASTAASGTLSDYLATSKVLAWRKATDRFLQILSFVHQAQGKTFEKVLQMSGRRRAYFARSKEEILNSGKSTHPQQIPNSPYWVMTNADTDQKKEMLSRALTILGYEPEVIRKAASLLDE